MKRIYEFLLWDNCNNNCKFCWQRENPRIYEKIDRLRILKEVCDFISSSKRFEDGSHILICGGEIFDKPSDFPALVAFFFNIVHFMKIGLVDLLYINTNLIYQDTRGLQAMFEMLKENHLLHRLRFTTSYDIEGRFRTTKAKDLMLSNLEQVSELYPDVQIVVNTILTKPACEAILNGRFDIVEFMNKNHCWVNLIPYIVLDNELTANRSMIFKTLSYVNEMCPGYLEKYVPNMAIKQEKWLYMYKDGDFQFCSCELSPECGHSVNFKRYSKEGTCFCCDLESVFREYA